MNRILILGVVLMGLLMVLPVSAQTAQTPDELCAAASVTDPATRQFEQPEQVLEPGIDYRAIFCTEKGAVYVNLFEQTTPITVNNFVFLAQQGFYNNSIFHRVIEDFMVQAGDPVGNPPGTGGPGYQFQDEFVGYLNFDRPGLLAMANANNPEQGILGTNGSQFFITSVVTDWLNQRHTIFGEVLEGQEVVESIPDNQSDPSIQTKLHTVLIITDPTTVSSDAQAPVPATQADVEAALADLSDTASAILGEGVEVDTEASRVVVAADEWVAAAPEPAQVALKNYVDTYPSEYHGAAVLVNTACNLSEIPLVSMAYRFDVHTSAEEAAAAFDLDQFTAIAAAYGLQPVESTYAIHPTFVGTRAACGSDGLTFAMSFQQIGRFIVSSELFFDGASMASEDFGVNDISAYLLTNFNDAAFGSLLGAIFRPEVR
jgi:peptidyl-prolyl cis-trans isomerase B (cyclophilin B)